MASKMIPHSFTTSKWWSHFPGRWRFLGLDHWSRPICTQPFHHSLRCASLRVEAISRGSWPSHQMNGKPNISNTSTRCATPSFYDMLDVDLCWWDFDKNVEVLLPLMHGRMLQWRMQVDVLSPLKKEEKAALAKCLTESCHEASHLICLILFAMSIGF